MGTESLSRWQRGRGVALTTGRTFMILDIWEFSFLQNLPRKYISLKSDKNDGDFT
jgi:hypothetical protein